MAILSRQDFLRMFIVPLTLGSSLSDVAARALGDSKSAGKKSVGVNSADPALVPSPKSYSPLAGTLKPKGPLAFNVTTDDSLSEQTVRLALNGALPLAEKANSSPSDSGLRLLLQSSGASNKSPEAYRLTVAKNEITVSSLSGKGLLMGLRTLAQLTVDGQIPLCEILDWPDVPSRAAHLCYHLIRESLAYNAPNFEALLEQIDQLAALKYNAVLLELESMFPYQRHPLVSCQIAFTPDQIDTIRKRLQAHQMEIIPMVQCLGHAYNVLIHEEYAGYREVPGTFQQYCPTHPKIADLYMEFVDEYLERFPGVRQWHMGGDESKQIGFCSRCKAKVEKVGKSRLYVDHVSEIALRLRKRGLTPMVWSDMLEAHPEDIARLPKDIKIVYWNYDMFNWTRPYAAGLFQRHGLQLIGAPAVRWEGTHTELSVNYLGRLRGIEGLIRRMHSEGCHEIMVTSWTKGSPHENTHYGFAYGADRCWNTEGSREDFDRRYAQSAFGTDDHSICNIYEMLSLKVPYAEGVSWHEWNHLNRFDLSGFRFPEKWKRYIRPEKEPQVLQELQTALETSRKAKAILETLAPKCLRGKRQLELLLTSAECIQAKAQFALALHRGRRLADTAIDSSEVVDWLAAQPAIVARWQEAKQLHQDMLGRSGFAPAVKFLNELMFEPIELNALIDMGRDLTVRLKSGQRS